jgi:hypothetical protein
MELRNRKWLNRQGAHGDEHQRKRVNLGKFDLDRDL